MEGSIREPELRNGGNVNTFYFSSSEEIFESVAQSLFTVTRTRLQMFASISASSIK